MREAGARLLGRDRTGRDVFLRGAPEGLRLVRKAAAIGRRAYRGSRFDRPAKMAQSF